MDDKTSKQTILVVDDSTENIDILRNILDKDYRVKIALNGPAALRLIETSDLPDLILLDITMPEMDGFTVCYKLKSSIRTKNIPVIFVTAKDEIIDEAEGFKSGAVDYITKPVSPLIVKARIKAQLQLYDQNRTLEEKVRLRTNELNETRLEIIRKLGVASEYKDNETGMHIVRISHYCKFLGNLIRLRNEENELLFQAAPMHDIGKIGIPDRILLKPGKLDNEEWEIMKNHTVIGSRILGDHDSDLLKTAKIIAMTHHEKWDGSGYPNGLSKYNIPLVGRIVAIADVFDALKNERPYKNAWPVADIISFFEENRGKHFDPALTDIFLENKEEIFKIAGNFSDTTLSSTGDFNYQN